MDHVRALNALKYHDAICHSAREPCTWGSSDGDQEAIQAHGERWPSSKSISLYSELQYHTIESDQKRTGGY
jgi:hypothetical protein